VGKTKWDQNTALQALKRILLEHGETISVHKYDQIRDPYKPAARTLKRLFPGESWSLIKARVIDGADNDKQQYLIKQNQRLIEQLEKQRNLTQIFIDNCLAAIEKRAFQPLPIPRKIKAKENLTFFALRSDAQVGQVNEERDTQGIAHYDFETYKRRAERWVEKVLSFKAQDQQSLGLNKLVINHLGDQVEGEDIYKGQPFYLDFPAVDQLFHSLEIETNLILRLAKEFHEIELFCVAGNHGRSGSPRSAHKRTNFDYIFYRCLQMSLRSQKNIKIFVSESPSMIVRHGKFHFLLNHGDTAKSWQGIPYYGLERMFRRLPDLYNMIIHYELVGHHHTPSNLADKIIMNGCLPGGSDFSVNKLHLSGLPSQKIFYFHPEHGINRETNLKLAEPITLQEDENRIFTNYT
jgi:hypothetical protein